MMMCVLSSFSVPKICSKSLGTFEGQGIVLALLICLNVWIAIENNPLKCNMEIRISLSDQDS